MATFNGAAGDGAHLRDQIDSILVQDGVDVDLLISDDGSTDGTAELCRAYSTLLPNVAFRQSAENLGVARNFMAMAYDADPAAHDYFAFADQDDLWLVDKLERATTLLEGAGPRALYYSDVTHVDARSGEILPSDAPLYEGLARNLGTLLVSNWAAGCTMVFDSELLRLLQAHPQARFARIHDAWVHLVALSCAKTVPDLAHSSIVHRITGENATLERVERDFGRLSARRLSSALRHIAGARDHAFSAAAEALLEGYGDLMAPRDCELCRLVASLPHSARSRLRALTNPALALPSALEQAMLKARILGNYL